MEKWNGMLQCMTKFVSKLLKPMKFDLLFLVITHMLYLHPHQTVLLAYFHHMIHWHMNTMQYCWRRYRVLISWTGANRINPIYWSYNHYPGLNTAELSSSYMQNWKGAVLVGIYLTETSRPPSKLEDLLFCMFLQHKWKY